ncbi:hypothetical protein GCM10011418_32830 [Sphingobacterium alkalisoli]|nr:hypothetical protein GCM10011418_32830 [Sphingobacterium alkalisoli]
MILFRSQFAIGSLVYLKTDVNQDQWMVVQVRFCPDGVSYYLSKGSDSYWAYEIEVSSEKDVVKALS